MYKPIFKIEYNQKDITKDISNQVLNIEYTDYEHGQSDEITITFDDTQKLWQSSWIPSKGDSIRVFIGYEGEKLLNCGVFEIDEIEFATPPDILTVKALATGITKALRQNNSVAYENKTTSFSVEIIAKSSDAISVTGITLSESEITVNIGYSKTICATIFPGNASNQNINWTTSDDSIAVIAWPVENKLKGFIIGYSEGTAIITATTEDGNFSASCVVEVVPVKGDLLSIEVTSTPTKTEYLEGKDALDLTGGKLTLYYNNDTTEVIDLSEVVVSGFDNTKVGEQTLTITYKGKTTTFKVNVIAKSLVSITVTTKPTKTEYLEAKEVLNLTGGKLALYYNNNTEEEIDLSEAVVTGFDNTKVGEQNLTVAYGDKTTTFKVKVTAKILVSIAVTANPTKMNYLEAKENLDLSGGKLTLTYNNGTTELFDLSNASVAGFNNTIVGEQVLTVTYNGKTTTFKVNIIAKTLTSIAVTSNPSKLTYLEGDAFNSSGMVVTAYYNNGTSAVITGYTMSGYTSTPGTKTITVSYGGKSTTFTVIVNAKTLTSIVVTTKPSKLTYLEGESFDKTGMVVTAYYNNGTSGIVTDYVMSGYSSTVGTKTVTVSYGGKSATFTVTVNARVPSSVTSDKYAVSGGNITKISVATTAAALLSNLNEGEYCKVYNGSAEVLANAAIGTGMEVKIMDGSTVKASYTAIVTGDINGDGGISVTDMISVKSYLLQKSTLSGVYATAADTNGDGSISITDFIQIKAHILGKGDVVAR